MASLDPEPIQSIKDIAKPKTKSSEGTVASVNFVPSKHLRQSRGKLCQKSFGFGSAPSVRRSEMHSSQIATEFRRPQLLFLPTYQLDSKHPFDVEAVTKLAEQIISYNLDNHKYDCQSSPALVMSLASELIRSVKALHYDRYRIITVVTIGEKRSQSYNNAIAFIWDGRRDTYVNITREEEKYFLQATIFGIYLD